MYVPGVSPLHISFSKSKFRTDFLTVSTQIMMRPSKLDLLRIYGKPVRYSIFLLRVWKYPTPNMNKEYI